MPIDPSISLRAIAPEPPDLLGQAVKVQTLKNAMQANRQNDLEQQAGKAYVFKADGSIDHNTTLQNLSRIDPNMALKFQREADVHQRGLMTSDIQNQETQRRIRADKVKQAKELSQIMSGVARGSLLAYQQVIQNGGSEDQARQAGDDLYKASLQRFRGEFPQSAQIPASFDPATFRQTVDADQGMLEQAAMSWLDDDNQGSMEGGGMMPAAFQQGEFVQTGRKKEPPVNADFGYSPPQQAPQQPAQQDSKGDKWRRNYDYTRLVYPKSNPFNMNLILDVDTGQVIPNEPLIAAKGKVAKHGAHNIQVAGGDIIEPGAVASTQMEKSLIDVNNGLARLDEIKQGFKPEYQTWLTQGSMKVKKWSEMLGMELSPENKKQLTEYSEYRQNAYDNLNRYIKEITGAQMSILEAERLSKAIPNPEGDSPTEFQAKVNRSIKQLEAAGKRYIEMRSQGFTEAQIMKRVNDGSSAPLSKYMKDDNPVVRPQSPKGPMPTAPGAPAAKPAALPPQALQLLREGQVTTFKNGTRWTLKDGKPAQVQ
jgi:hypothetical protein